MSTETVRLIRDGGKGYDGGGKREIIYLSLHCHHLNDSCIKMGSDESHFSVSLIVRVTRQCPQTTIFEEKGEPKWIQTGPSAYQPNTLRLGQTGSCQVDFGSLQILVHKSALPQLCVKNVLLPRKPWILAHFST